MSYCKFCGAWQVYLAKSEACKDCGKRQDDPDEVAWYCARCGKFEYLGAGVDLCSACRRADSSDERRT